MLVAAALLSTALAADPIAQVGDQIELQMAGTWGRVIPVEGGWMYAFGRNGDYWVAPLERDGDGWALRREQELQLTTHGDLKDHAIRRCPDGTYLHTASANLDQPNDTAYVYRYDADWSRLGDAPIEEREPRRYHNDMPLLCSDDFTGTAFSGSDDFGGFFSIELETLASERVASFPRGAFSTGSAMLANGDGTFTLLATSFEGDLTRFVFDQDFNLVSEASTPLAESPDERIYWPQGALKVGDHYIVAVMSRDASAPGDDGDIVLVVLDEGWDDLIQRVNITNNPADNMGMRPWIARKGSTLLVSYDRQREHTVIEVALDLEALGLDPADDDTGWEGDGGAGGDGGEDGDTAAAGADGDTEGCGCSQGGPMGGLMLASLGGLVVARRRR